MDDMDLGMAAEVTRTLVPIAGWILGATSTTAVIVAAFIRPNDVGAQRDD